METTADKTNVRDYYSVVRERRSVRHYDPSVKISREELTEMLEEAVLAPSSSNLQPWRFLVIDEQPLKEKLLPIAFNQQQVLDASAVIAVLGDKNAYLQAEAIYQSAVEAGYMDEERKQLLTGHAQAYERMGEDGRKDVVLIDGGLVSMQFMLSAKARGYDTVPMAGYNAQQFREAFGIPDSYATVMLIAVGKASQPGHPTTRLPIGDVTSWNRLESK
ncbi:nitroreductase family protein [Paenibacillus mucilaginosus]|uniref:Putative NAD(P)H nitroreductase n=1 Tax=Paenibacillus mucilaginosus (strain KNP414) TaxID=1036673 RepID=F8FE87_PAEMK|nr:nitroreductase family protein [Paenibacillus mucilaginosus]AEI43846.1 putative NAD(P)H nitroreductase [Paenibacillus mucilaginosus KNP414]MCG7212642.1 nitroreductase family protein [Paenibacillus mucilaginosus]WDM25338.1 nitroreductase family protein [Paenibacillus mucilaginosus]